MGKTLLARMKREGREVTYITRVVHGNLGGQDTCPAAVFAEPRYFHRRRRDAASLQT